MTRLVKALLSSLCFALIRGRRGMAQTANPPIFVLPQRRYLEIRSDRARPRPSLRPGATTAVPSSRPMAARSPICPYLPNSSTQFEAGTATQTGGDSASQYLGHGCRYGILHAHCRSSLAPAQRGSCDRCPIGRQTAASSYGSKWILALQTLRGAIDHAPFAYRCDFQSALARRNVDLGFQGRQCQRAKSCVGAKAASRGCILIIMTAFRQSIFAYSILRPRQWRHCKQYDLGLNESRDNTVRDFIWVDHLGSSIDGAADQRLLGADRSTGWVAQSAFGSAASA